MNYAETHFADDLHYQVDVSDHTIH